MEMVYSNLLTATNTRVGSNAICIMDLELRVAMDPFIGATSNEDNEVDLDHLIARVV
jgi:hypothetical protein